LTYLNWLKKHDVLEGESSPIGLILCAEKSSEYIELLELGQGNIRVADYLTHQLPSPPLEQKLHWAIEEAHQRLTHSKDNEPVNGKRYGEDSLTWPCQHVRRVYSTVRDIKGTDANKNEFLVKQNCKVPHVYVR
jgi:hypothetical protein